jgi:hypothetical protein
MHAPPTSKLNRNFRFGLRARTSYASPALGTTNLPSEQASTERVWRSSPDKRDYRNVGIRTAGQASFSGSENISHIGETARTGGVPTIIREKTVQRGWIADLNAKYNERERPKFRTIFTPPKELLRTSARSEQKRELPLFFTSLRIPEQARRFRQAQQASRGPDFGPPMIGQIAFQNRLVEIVVHSAESHIQKRGLTGTWPDSGLDNNEVRQVLSTGFGEC